VDESFLTDILGNPGDVGPRLVYADWLEDRGGPGDAERAEFIREPFGAGPERLSTRSREYPRRLALVAATLQGVVPRSYRLYFGDGKDLRAGQTLTESMKDAAWFVSHRYVCVVVRHGFITEVGCDQRYFVRTGWGLLEMEDGRCRRGRWKMSQAGRRRFESGRPL
jgi:uncharacterized protein (TIGR02996 family)